MMCKEKSSLWSCTKALYIIPLAVVAACTFSSPKDDESSVKVNENVVDVEMSAAKTESLSADIKSEKSNETVAPSAVPEKNAQFKGGPNAMMSYIAQNTKYPQQCVDESVEGRVLINFIITKEGLVKDAAVMKSSGNKQLDDEALRVVSGMPAFIPAVDKDGNNVQVNFALPVVFKLNK